MFVKRVAKHTLAENFEEAKTIEFQMKGCKEVQVSLGHFGKSDIGNSGVR
jgi:hypothetical protein